MLGSGNLAQTLTRLKLNWVVLLQYSLLITTELGQGGSAGYGGVDVLVPNDLT